MSSIQEPSSLDSRLLEDLDHRKVDEWMKVAARDFWGEPDNVVHRRRPEDHFKTMSSSLSQEDCKPSFCLVRDDYPVLWDQIKLRLNRGVNFGTGGMVVWGHPGIGAFFSLKLGGGRRSSQTLDQGRRNLCSTSSARLLASAGRFAGAKIPNTPTCSTMPMWLVSPSTMSYQACSRDGPTIPSFACSTRTTRSTKVVFPLCSLSRGTPGSLRCWRPLPRRSAGEASRNIRMRRCTQWHFGLRTK